MRQDSVQGRSGTSKAEDIPEASEVGPAAQKATQGGWLSEGRGRSGPSQWLSLQMGSRDSLLGARRLVTGQAPQAAMLCSREVAKAGQVMSVV